MNLTNLPLLPPALQRLLARAEQTAATPATTPDESTQEAELIRVQGSLLARLQTASVGKVLEITAKVASAQDQLTAPDTAVQKPPTSLLLRLAGPSANSGNLLEIRLPVGNPAPPEGTLLALRIQGNQVQLGPAQTIAEPRIGNLASAASTPPITRPPLPDAVLRWISQRLAIAEPASPGLRPNAAATITRQPAATTYAPGQMPMVDGAVRASSSRQGGRISTHYQPSAIGIGLVATPTIRGPQLASVLVQLLSADHPTPAREQAAIQRLTDQLPGPLQLATRDGIRQSIANSGLFTESRLLQTISKAGQSASAEATLTLANRLFASSSNHPAAPGSATPHLQASPTIPDQTAMDLKVLLSRLLTRPPESLPEQSRSAAATSQTTTPLTAIQSDNTPTTSQRQLQAALTDIEITQFRLQHSHSQPAQEAPQLQCSLLYQEHQQPRALELQLQADDQTDHPDIPRARLRHWRLRLQLELEPGNPLMIDARIGWPRIAVTFWSRQTDVLQQLQQALPELRQRLQQCGADVQEIEARFGHPAPLQGPTIRPSLVDLFT